MPSHDRSGDFIDRGTKFVFAVVTILSLPAEMVLKPQFGSRYFTPLALFFSSCMMLIIGAIGGLTAFLPFSASATGAGIVGGGMLLGLFMAGSSLHGYRIWRRMQNIPSEPYSYAEGPSLPFFYLLPKSDSWAWLRIVHEPAFVLILAIALSMLGILNRVAAGYLFIAALALSCKAMLTWYERWQYRRGRADAEFLSQMLTEYADGKDDPAKEEIYHQVGLPLHADARKRKDIARQVASQLPAEWRRLLTPVENANIAPPAKVNGQAGYEHLLTTPEQPEIRQ